VERTLHSLKNLEDFVLNKLLGNLAMSQDFDKLSSLRQKVISNSFLFLSIVGIERTTCPWIALLDPNSRIP